MSIEAELIKRSGSKCELCQSVEGVSVFEVGPDKVNSSDKCAYLCSSCSQTLSSGKVDDVNHWYCLNESMWSEHAVVQVLAYRALKMLKGETWASDLLDQLYLEDDVRAWAEAGVPSEDENKIPTKDSNGTILQDGDSIFLIKDLVVKGANFTAKRGTTVKNISLTDDPKLIEGRVNGTHIVLVAAYLKKL